MHQIFHGTNTPAGRTELYDETRTANILQRDSDSELSRVDATRRLVLEHLAKRKFQ